MSIFQISLLSLLKINCITETTYLYIILKSINTWSVSSHLIIVNKAGSILLTPYFLNEETEVQKWRDIQS